MISLYDHALAFATEAHAGQVRKYTGEPYINHPIAVSWIVQSVTNKEDVAALALLHDTVEDTDVTSTDILREFGSVMEWRLWFLTDPDVVGNRLYRKTRARYNNIQGDEACQTVKIADMIDNTISIKQYDPKFWKQYRVEKLLLLGGLFHGDKTLWKRAYDLCVEDIT